MALDLVLQVAVSPVNVHSPRHSLPTVIRLLVNVSAKTDCPGVLAMNRFQANTLHFWKGRSTRPKLQSFMYLLMQSDREDYLLFSYCLGGSIICCTAISSAVVYWYWICSSVCFGTSSCVVVVDSSTNNELHNHYSVPCKYKQ
jgi:hypothetical protein